MTTQLPVEARTSGPDDHSVPPRIVVTLDDGHDALDLDHGAGSYQLEVYVDGQLRERRAGVPASEYFAAYVECRRRWTKFVEKRATRRLTKRMGAEQ